MNYEDIKTYKERCDKHQGIITHQMCIELLIDEIEELRQYIESKLKEEND